MHNHQTYLQRCLDIALKGQGFVAPNPMVGSVLVVNGKIIGEGYHKKYGEAHAEVNAINSVQNKELLKSATLYVNLEPCSHHGKTPPCSDLIIASGIPSVVIGCQDSYSEVSGKGIEKLKRAGIDVIVGVLEKESRELNRRFFTFHEKKRPYVILKWAQSEDGFIDIDRSAKSKGIVWISEEGTKKLVHEWRHDEASILVGWKTIANDNPHLTVREFDGKNPVRIVLDPHLHLDYNAFHVGDRKAKTIILTAKKAIGDENLQFISPEDFNVLSILKTLWENNIQSVLIEGGKTTLEHFIASNVWDEARVITGTKKLLSGQYAPVIQKESVQEFSYGNDHIQIFRNA